MLCIYRVGLGLLGAKAVSHLGIDATSGQGIVVVCSTFGTTSYGNLGLNWFYADVLLWCKLAMDIENVSYMMRSRLQRLRHKIVACAMMSTKKVASLKISLKRLIVGPETICPW